MKDLDRYSNLREAKNAVLAAGLASDEDGAAKYLKNNIHKEEWYQKRIKKYLLGRCPGAFIWKATAGPYTISGVPDLCMIYKDIFFGFEVKRPYFGKLSELQKRSIDEINKNGGYAGVVIFPEDAEKIIQEAFNEVK